MARYQIITLVDITRSQAGRSETDKVKLSQQANFNSLIQAIGLRSNIDWSYDPRKHTGSLPLDIEGKATHWIWEFDTERDLVYHKENDPVGLLVDDLHNVPIIDMLENSVDIVPAAFQTKGDAINTWVNNVT